MQGAARGLVDSSALPQLLASASYDDTVKLYHEEEDDWVCCATLEGHESTVWSVAFDRSGERLASCSDDKTVRIWRQYKPGNEEGEAHGLSCRAAGLRAAHNLLGKKSGQGKRAGEELRLFSCLPGVACSGTDPTWKCVCNLSGYHTRTIYDVAW